LQVARIIGVAKYTVTCWELNYNEPEVEYIPKILEFIGYCPYVPAHSPVERLKQVRWALGITQQQLATLLGVVRSQIVSWETGRHQPTKKSLMLIADFLSSASLEAEDRKRLIGNG